METKLIIAPTLHLFVDEIFKAQIEGWEIDMEKDVPVFTGLVFTATASKGSIKKPGRPKKDA